MGCLTSKKQQHTFPSSLLEQNRIEHIRVDTVANLAPRPFPTFCATLA